VTQFTVNPLRFDPYKNFKFRVKWDGKYVAGISKVSALKRSTEVLKHREGGDPSTSRKSPGRTEYEAITLERGVTHDPEFERWANKVGFCRRSNVLSSWRNPCTAHHVFSSFRRY
jgi:phage tail-like protein